MITIEIDDDNILDAFNHLLALGESPHPFPLCSRVLAWPIAGSSNLSSLHLMPVGAILHRMCNADRGER